FPYETKGQHAMACGNVLVLNASQPLQSVWLSNECLCQGHFDYAVVPRRHADARCLQQARWKLPEAIDAQEALVNFAGGHVRQQLAESIVRCKKRRGRRLFWTLKLIGLVKDFARIDQVQKAFLLCVPRPCSADATSAWLAPAFFGADPPGPVEPFRCGGSQRVVLPPRLAIPMEADPGMRSYVLEATGQPGRS
ncbi:unnamed protein product, partial [Effrenium voratum]